MESQVNVRFSQRDLNKIDEAIKKGYYMNRSDFTRQAVREKITSLEKVSA